MRLFLSLKLGSGFALPFNLLNVVHKISIFKVIGVPRTKVVPGPPFQYQILYLFDQRTRCQANQLPENLLLQTNCVKKSHTGNCFGINHFNIGNEWSIKVFVVWCFLYFFMRVDSCWIVGFVSQEVSRFSNFTTLTPLLLKSVLVNYVAWLRHLLLSYCCFMTSVDQQVLWIGF